MLHVEREKVENVHQTHRVSILHSGVNGWSVYLVIMRDVEPPSACVENSVEPNGDSTSRGLTSGAAAAIKNVPQPKKETIA